MDGQLIVSIGTGAVALAALVFSVVSFSRQQKRADQYETARVKPHLWIKSQYYEDLKSIVLVNSGVGPAIIREATFTKGDLSKRTNAKNPTSPNDDTPHRSS